MNTERLNEIYNKFPKVELEKVELNSIKDIPKYESELKGIQKGMQDIDKFKSQTKPKMLEIVKWLNQLKTTILQIGLSYKDVKGLNEVNDLYNKVSSDWRKINK
jgi:hypothetical protein